MKKLKLIGALALVLLLGTIIWQNTQPVTTRILFVTITMPNALQIGLTLLVGVAIGILLAMGLVGRHGKPAK